MSKQTFDQVSAAKWGKNALDYHTNYIIPRSHWDDSDIRDEALYFAGFAHGLRVGASQKQCQATMRQNWGQEQVIVLGNGKDKKLAVKIMLGIWGQIGAFAHEARYPRILLGQWPSGSQS